MRSDDAIREQELRRRLGIPAGAERVILFAESSHWDPGWLKTSEEYYDLYVRRTLDEAIAELGREPARVYSIECLFYLRRYWEDRPSQQATIRSFVNAGRLRLTATGVTTPDTCSPDPEAILRDFLLGQEWLRAEGMTVEPRLAYFPDNFGHSAALPSLLNAAGFDRTALTRVDGMRFLGDFGRQGEYNWPGSSAARLLKEERTLDFVWRDEEGSELLCHWNAYTYGQGDMLAHRGLARVYFFPLAMPDSSDGHVARRIASYTGQLAPYSRTPYLFCPIGMDFIRPIPGLLGLLERYNRRHYPHTGVWAANAGLDDYLALIECYRARLPVLNLDPNPYWTGWPTARPVLKRACHELVDTLLLADALLATQQIGEDCIPDVAAAWWIAATSNHHDYISGTSTDRVVENEQLPWIRQATELIRAAQAAAAKAPDPTPAHKAGRRSTATERPTWSLHDGLVEVETPFLRCELAEEAGGCIVRVGDPSGRRLLDGPSADVISYFDSGGLWRLGADFAGGAFSEVARASQRPARLHVRESEDGLAVISALHMDGMTLVRRLTFGCAAPLIGLEVDGLAGEKRTLTLRLETGLPSRELWMDTPGGTVTRPLRRHYDPTFWALHSFVHLQGEERGAALCLALPGSIAAWPGGRLEAITQRNATIETAYGFLHFAGNPVRGHERDVYNAEMALLFTGAGDWAPQNLPALAYRAANAATARAARAQFAALAAALVEVDPPGVFLTALKLASRGVGLILRLYAPGRRGQEVSLSMRDAALAAAYLCDARERDLRPLEVRGGSLRLAMPGPIATVRMEVDLK